MSSRFRGNQRGDHRGRSNYGSRGRYNGGGGQGQGNFRSRDQNDYQPRYHDGEPRNYGSNRGRSGQRTDRPHVEQSRSGRQEPVVKSHELDLQRLLKEISINLSSLAGRVEAIEKNKGSDSHSAAANRPKPAVPAGPLLQKNNSKNNDFASVSKALYKIVQIGHHAGNWEHLPKSIDERLNRLVADINPPMSDASFRSELAVLTQQYGEEVRRLVSDHLLRKRTEMEIAAGLLDETDISQAKDLAAKYLTARLGKRLVFQRRTELLDSAASKVGVLRRPPPITTIPNVASTSPWTTVTRKTPPRATTPQVTNSTRKRKIDSLNSTPLSNRFDALNNEVIANDVEPDDSLSQVGPSDQPPASIRQPRKRPTVCTDVITEYGVHVHSGEKTDWFITPDSSETSVIVVGDSNLRKTMLIPKYWQINSLPGANLCNITNGISKLTGVPKQFTVIIQAGVNHRSYHNTDDEHDIRSMLFDARRNPSIGEIFFNGVSIPADMDAADADRLNRLNRFMEAELGGDYYIPPLQQADVRVAHNDRFGIHYDQATVDRISAKMIRHVTGSDF